MTIGEQAAALAQNMVGRGYLWGAPIDTSLRQFAYDCSSFVASIYGSLGKSLPRTSQAQAAYGQGEAAPQIGDLVFGSFSSPNDHVGIYVGNGTIISALDPAHGVTSSAMNWPGMHFESVVPMQNQVGIFATPIVPTSPQPSGPGGNTIVPNPATPNEWPKMLIAIVIVSGGIWFLSTFNEQYATWLAIITVGGMATYYELHGNHQFSNGIKDLSTLIGQK